MVKLDIRFYDMSANITEQKFHQQQRHLCAILRAIHLAPVHVTIDTLN